MAVSQDSIDSINDTIVTQPTKSKTSSVSASERILNGTISSGITNKPPLQQQQQPLGSIASSSFDRSSAYSSSPSSQLQQQTAESISATFESYRPLPPMTTYERINPFDKNKPVTSATSVNFSPSAYTSPYTTTSSSSSTTAAGSTLIGVKDEKKQSILKDSVLPFKPDLPSASAGFDYRYKPAPPLPGPPLIQPPVLPPSKIIDDDEPEDEPKPKRRHEFERKLSDADIIFGATKIAAAAEPSFKINARNRSNSSFTSTTTDSDYVYGSRQARRDNSFQKSLSVSSDKDGDFTHDPEVLATRAGINNDAFSDFDSPLKTTSSANKSWSNIDDDDLK